VWDVMSEDRLKNRGFSAQKLALLASLLDEEGVRQAPSLKRISREGELPLSSAQMRLWLFDQLEPGSSAYNIPVRHDFKGPFDVAAFERSLSEIVRRHEVLRTCYLRVDGRPVQKIVPPESFRVPVIDLQDSLRGLPEAAREQEVASLASAFAKQPIELGSAPLLRANLLKLSGDEHVLLFNVNHIAYDWWSFGVFEKELAALYDAFVRGEASPLTDLPLQYVDFTAWQQERLQGEILREQLEYWQKKLGGEMPTLELPTDRPRPAIQTYNGTFVSSAISKELTEGLKTLSQREGTTLFATLLGAFKVLLQRYTGDDDILVGVPIAGRNRAEIEGLIGFFVNALVMRTDLSGDPSFRQFLRRVHETSLGAYAHQDLPFEKLVEVLNPKRDSSRSPMFQVMLSMLNTPMQPLQLPGLQHRRTMLDSGTAKFDITLYAIEEPTGLSFTCEYNSDLFHSDRIERMLGHLEVLLGSIVDDPDRRLSELPILTEEERQEILIGWNDTRLAYPQDVLLHQLFERQAERTPEAVAVEFGGDQLTYGELNRRANQLAHYLRSQAVGSETLVGICMERSLEMVVGLLGILKAGAAYVPLDPAYPKERLAFMVEDAQVRVLLTRDGGIGWVHEDGIKTVRMDSDAQEIDRQSDANPMSTATANNLAYVIYTSGSTGKSKGVQIAHRSVVNFLTSMRQRPGLAEKDVLLSVTTLSFDIAALEIFLPLTVGARLVLVSREVAADGARLSEQLDKSGATVMQATPATWRLLLEAGWQGRQRLKILCGGEALDRELANQLLKRCADLWNLYGPTETTIWSAIHKVELEPDLVPELKTGPVSIGRPIANTQLYVLDRHLQPVPVGVTGELLIGGDGLARGYLNRPELTAEKLVPNPFSDDADARLSHRLYRTGDLARYLPDGSLDFLGRNDYQVKIRGFRIELGEIEAALGGHPSVQKAVVLAREDVPGEKRLVAYVVPAAALKSEQAAPVDALRNFLKEKLPAHMVPPFFVFMEKMPLTPNGKINRKALPAPQNATSGGVGVMGVAPGFEAPRDPLEQSLAQIWSKILKVKKIGIRDNFFELGGHSLLAVRITAEIERLVKRNLPLATFLQAPTIADLAEVLRKKDWKPSWSSLIPLRAGGSKPPFFLMHSHGGNVLEYYPLAESLEVDQPVYALQARGLDGLIIKDQSFEAMVEAHLRELRSLQPEGPYFLGGYCLGGLLALEAARQLTASGEQVGLVVLIQTINPTYARFRPDVAIWQRAWYRASKRIDLELAYLRHRGGSHILERGRRTRDMALARTAIAYDNWRGDGHGRRTRTSMALTLELLAIEHERARARYELRPYNGPVLLFRASRQIGGIMADSDLGWKDVLTGELTVCEVPGHQETMLLEPNVSSLAKELTAKLRAVQYSPVVT
jgi:amino acid adenylation domain-containing protein